MSGFFTWMSSCWLPVPNQVELRVWIEQENLQRRIGHVDTSDLCEGKCEETLALILQRTSQVHVWKGLDARMWWVVPNVTDRFIYSKESYFPLIPIGFFAFSVTEIPLWGVFSLYFSCDWISFFLFPPDLVTLVATTIIAFQTLA